MEPAGGGSWAMAYLGWTYHQSWLDFKDYRQAVTWSRKAADLGEPLGQSLLGDCYLEGVGIEQDLEEGVKWLSAAASAKFAPAQLVLGRLYLTGDRVAGDARQRFRAVARSRRARGCPSRM